MHAPQMASYRIIVEGIVDPTWIECLGGLAVTEQRQSGQPTTTLLEGRLVDQSALQGVINTIFMIGLPLMSIERRSVA